MRSVAAGLSPLSRCLLLWTTSWSEYVVDAVVDVNDSPGVCCCSVLECCVSSVDVAFDVVGAVVVDVVLDGAGAGLGEACCLERDVHFDIAAAVAGCDSGSPEVDDTAAADPETAVAFC